VGQFDCGRVPGWKIDGPKRIFLGWRQLCNAIAAPSISLRAVCNTLNKKGVRIGNLPVSSITPRAADKLSARSSLKTAFFTDD
jgi:hypothetical protein